MNWLRSSPIDEQVDRATSENLPAGAEDLALNLEICDQIRSKQVSSKDAAKALKRRISHKNPNVQLLALGLTDACVKNGGQHFLVEIASRDFIDNMMSILRAPAGCNQEVKSKILMLIQTWGRLFRGKQELGYVCDVYMILQHEGYQFPPADNVGAALVETAAPPDWTDSDVCTRCRTAFTLTNRKHHCRACGSTFCGQCSSKTTPLPHLGINQDVRVCDGCWMKKKMGGKGTAVQDSDDSGGSANFVSVANPSRKPATNSFPNTSSSASAVEYEDWDDELRKVIELSLKEANSRPGYSEPSSIRKEPESTTRSIGPSADEENDADLLAAIEASLRETSLNASSKNTSQTGKQQSAYEAYTYSATTESKADPVNNLTETERENIEMFSSLVDKIQMMNGDVAGNREVQALYEQISRLQMKVALSIEEADKKQREVVQFNEKIDQAVKLYDHLLQERLNTTYQNRMSNNNYGYPGLQKQADGPLAGYNASSPAATHVYPHLSGTESRYSQYAPVAPHIQQSPQPFAPQAPYQYQSSQPPATAPFNISSPSGGPTGPEFASAHFASAPPPGQSISSQASYQPSQDPYYASAPGPYALSSPSTQSGGQFHQPGFSLMATPFQSIVADQISQAPYASYTAQHSQQQPINSASSQAYAPVAPVAPVEEKPLIEF
ncbi:Vacuolar protein-sorting-associated protein 27 [Mortierella sp. AM989]|nr:Vacuolar protein-sorting-associated protein 27 [Mortierella sp. AM989]